MIEEPTQRTAGEFVSIIPQVVRLLCTLAADGIYYGDTHPGNFGLFDDGDVRIIDWADARFDAKPEDPSLIWRLVSKGFGRFKMTTTGQPVLRAGVHVHPSWKPLLRNLNDALAQWQSDHHSNPVAGLGRLAHDVNASAVPLLDGLPEFDLPESATNSSAGAVRSLPPSTIATPRETSANRLPHMSSDGLASAAVRGTISNAVQDIAFKDLRERCANASLYTDCPNKRWHEHAQGRSGRAEVCRDEYLKIHAVSVFVWHYIQREPFCYRFDAQPPPKSYADKGEFQQWLFQKMKMCIASSDQRPLANHAYWTHLMAILRRAWQCDRGRVPQCNWKGWFFREHDFDRMELVMRHAFSTGFGVLPITRRPGS
jgi:hypothetical protein